MALVTFHACRRELGPFSSQWRCRVYVAHKSLLEAQILLDQNNRDATGQHFFIKIIAKEEGRGMTFVTDTSMVLLDLLSRTCLPADDVPLMRVMPRPIPK